MTQQTISIDAGPETVTISVRDEGPGFPPPDQQPTIQDPARTHTSNEHEEQGMGLPLARRLIEAMPGRLTISRPGPRPQIDIVLAIASTEANFRTADHHR